MTSETHRLWLRVAAVLLGIFGPVFFIGTMAGTSEPVRWSLDLLSWPIDGAQTYTDPTLRFVSALTAWFFLDSAGSIASGNASNALFNILVLLILVGPMWFPAKKIIGVRVEIENGYTRRLRGSV